MRAAGIFGGSQASGAHSYFNRHAAAFNPHRVEGYPDILAVTNLDEDGEPTLGNGGLGSQEVVWHSDNSCVETPLDALWAHATRPGFTWERVWRDGDAVLWDNRCTMHHRTLIDPSRRRAMHRIRIAGEPVIAPW